MQVRRSLSSKIPNELLDGNLELGVISYDPGDERLKSKVIYTDALAFVVSPQHRLAHRKTVSITELGSENFHRAQRALALPRGGAARVSARTRCRCSMDVEMPTIETIRKLVQNNEGVAFLPRMCVEQEIEQKTAVRGAGEGDARGAEDPAGLSHAPRAEPRGQGVSGSGGVTSTPFGRLVRLVLHHVSDFDSRPPRSR